MAREHVGDLAVHERPARVDKVASRTHRARRGHPDDIRRKLAETDPVRLAYVENVLQKQSGVVEALGAADSETNESPRHQAGVDDAFGRFRNWILS